MTHTAPAIHRPTFSPTCVAGWLLMLGLGAAQAGQIFTCVDAKGRRLTADRPIMECLDREQRELAPSGSVKRVVPPSYTADERAAAEDKQKAAEAEQAKQQEDRRRERALRVRYPNQAAHDKARADALSQANAVLDAVRSHGEELDKQHRQLETEFEFYRNSPEKAPAWLKKRQDDNAQQRAKVTMEMADKEREKTRINARFDDELTQLRKLWGQGNP